jgi:hypothetical protein
MIFPQSNLPTSAQPWAREVTKQLTSIIANVATNEVNNNARDNQLKSSIDAISKVSTVVSSGPAAEALTKANQALGGLGSLSSPDSAYTIDQDNVIGLISDLSLKAPIASPTFTGTVAGITKAMVGLGSVDNTTDANKPVSTATQTALDLKANIASPTFTGTVTGTPATPANTGSASSIGFIGMPQTLLASGGLTLSASHAGDHIYITGTGQILTIPANASVPLEIGTTFVFINGGAITTTIAITTDTMTLAGTTTTGSRTLGTNGMATAVKVTATSWIISGNGLT